LSMTVTANVPYPPFSCWYSGGLRVLMAPSIETLNALLSKMAFSYSSWGTTCSSSNPFSVHTGGPVACLCGGRRWLDLETEYVAPDHLAVQLDGEPVIAGLGQVVFNFELELVLGVVSGVAVDVDRKKGWLELFARHNRARCARPCSPPRLLDRGQPRD